MVRYFPPKGYRTTDQPLLHECNQVFSLEGEATTKDSTIVCLFKQTEECNAPETVEVNNTNDNFAIDRGTAVHRYSIVDKLRMQMHANMSKLSIETDKLRQLNFYWAPMYVAFLNNLDAEDEKSGLDVESQVELTHETTNKDTFPLFSTVKLTGGGNVPLTTVGFAEDLADVGLTTTAVIESVAWESMRTWFERIKHFSNGGMMKSIIPRWHKVLVSRDRAYHTVMTRTNPKVKRANNYMFCGIMVHMPQIGSINQYYNAADSTSIAHIDFKFEWSFEEWNTSFEQASI